MDIIIIGAGAAGLMAAKKLSEAGLSVSVLEARDRIGGRIHTIEDDSVAGPVEGGAEFIHGNLEVTLDLLNEAGVDKLGVNGEFWQVTNGIWSQQNDLFENAGTVIKHLKSLKEDISIAAFTARFFAEDKYKGLRQSLISYIEGYYSGETEKTSAKAFLEEWLTEDEEQQFRPMGGYGKMINYLAESCKQAGVTINLSTVAKEVRWQKGHVEIIDEKGNSFIASKALITVPLGVWLADKNAKAGLAYAPSLPLKDEAVKQMGFGSVIKVLLEFKEIFWEDLSIKTGRKAGRENFHMVFSDLPIPTWWTQLPERTSLLTGWLSGPKAEKLKNEKDENILDQSIYSLGKIFSMDDNILREKLRWCKVFNWTNDPFTLGSYSYSTLHTNEARKIVEEPVQSTLFFAGEALYEGPEMGTVEAALISGLKAAQQIVLA